MEPDETTAQDVIDALRLVLTQDDVDVAVIESLVADAPETDGTSSRGVRLLLDNIGDGHLKLEAANAAA